MKKCLNLLLIFISLSLFSQWSSSYFPISTTVSSSFSKSKVTSVSFDSNYPSERGISRIYDMSMYKDNLLYEIPRAFDLDSSDKNTALFISDNGENIVYFTNIKYYDDVSENKAVVIYKKGKLFKNYSVDEFHNCNSKQEKCGLFYYNEKLINRKETNNTLIVLNKDMGEDEIYLKDNFIFAKNDSIYIVDARKKVTIFDLSQLKILNQNIEFNTIFSKIKNLNRGRNSYVTNIKSPEISDISKFVNVENKNSIAEDLSSILNLKSVKVGDADFYKYYTYNVNITGYLTKSGEFIIENFKIDNRLNKEKILKYLTETRFESDFLPKETEKFYFPYFFTSFREKDDALALKITNEEKKIKELRATERLTLKEIDGVYIPKDMKECMLELDKILNFETKKLLLSENQNLDLNGHMGGLGMWIRNNWGINGGSRLKVYFHKRNIGKSIWGNDAISGIIIENYILWIKGNKNIWKEWEKKNKIK